MYGAFVLALGLVYIIVDVTPMIFPWGTHELRLFAGVILGATVVAVAGALDDKFELSPFWQSFSLVLAGAVLIVFDVRIDSSTNPFAHGITLSPGKPHDPRVWFGFSPLVSDFVTIVWVFGVAKTVDFMDGLDGLAAGISAISGATLALMAAQAGQYEVSIIAAALVGVCIGFLRHNYNPASIIMGMSGRNFWGSCSRRSP